MLGKKKKVDAATKKQAEPIKYDTLQTMHGEFTTIVTESYKNRKTWVRPDPRQVFSFIPGTITEILVEVGSVVEKEDKLLMFKAMKMDNTFHSPVGGRVKVIHVKVGEIVPKGVLLLEFE